MNNILFHTLKGIRGWSHCELSKIDVAKVISLDYHERLFKIFDTNHPYTLTIEYKEPKHSTTVSPVFAGKGGITINDVTVTEQTITKRYKSEKDVKKEVIEIKIKQEELEKMTREKENELLSKVSRRINSIDVNKVNKVKSRKRFIKPLRYRKK